MTLTEAGLPVRNLNEGTNRGYIGIMEKKMQTTVQGLGIGGLRLGVFALAWG